MRQWTKAAQRRLFLQMCRHGHDALLALITDFGGSFFRRQQVDPPLHDAVGFREEAVPSDVHAIALVANGAGDAADFVTGFEDNGANVGATQKFKRGGEASRTGPDDDSGLLIAHLPVPMR